MANEVKEKKIDKYKIKKFCFYNMVSTYQIENLRIFEQPKTIEFYGVKRAPQNYLYVEDRY